MESDWGEPEELTQKPSSQSIKTDWLSTNTDMTDNIINILVRKMGLILWMSLFLYPNTIQ